MCWQHLVRIFFLVGLSAWVSHLYAHHAFFHAPAVRGVSNLQPYFRFLLCSGTGPLIASPVDPKPTPNPVPDPSPPSSPGQADGNSEGQPKSDKADQEPPSQKHENAGQNDNSGLLHVHGKIALFNWWIELAA